MSEELQSPIAVKMTESFLKEDGAVLVDLTTSAVLFTFPAKDVADLSWFAASPDSKFLAERTAPVLAAYKLRGKLSDTKGIAVRHNTATHSRWAVVTISQANAALDFATESIALAAKFAPLVAPKDHRSDKNPAAGKKTEAEAPAAEGADLGAMV